MVRACRIPHDDHRGDGDDMKSDWTIGLRIELNSAPTDKSFECN